MPSKAPASEPKRFTVHISFGQLAVFDSSKTHPFNEWTEAHVRQGFAWREGSVSFRTIEEGGDHFVTVAVTDELPDIPDAALRVINVPFEVPGRETVEVAGISDSHVITIPAGLYTLRYEAYATECDLDPAIRLIFARDMEPSFRVPVADGELSVTDPLLTSARAAI